jgi:hypothetical protein
MPDIDIDFCVRGRGDVINHVGIGTAATCLPDYYFGTLPQGSN